MRILFAADRHLYSAYAVEMLTRLAENTWADVTLLGVLPKEKERPASPGSSTDLDDPLLDALIRYREKFLAHWPSGESPYAPTRTQYEWISLKPGLWEQMLVNRGALKDLKVRIRFGQPVQEILNAAQEDGCSLILMGCTGGDSCLWSDFPATPQKVVSDAPVSVFLVKEAAPIRKIFLCLDDSDITQEALEMVNQMVSINSAELDVVGLTKGGGIKREVFPWLSAVYDYYRNKGIPANIRFSEIEDFQNFISSEVTEGMLALWLGKQSLLSRLFQKKKDSIEHFVKTCKTSVLVLR